MYGNNTTEVIKDIEKGSRGDVIRISKVTNSSSGTVNCDIRLYYTNDDDELAPTKKGCRFNAESVYDVVVALMQFMTVDEVESLATVVGDMLCDGEDPEGDGVEESAEPTEE